MQELTVTEWAGKEGISKQAAYKRIRSGKVSVNKSGKIDDASAAQWNRNRDVRQQQRNHPVSDAPAKGDKTSLSEAQRAREWLRVKKERIAVDKLEGKLVELAPINAWVAGMIIKAREELTKIAPELRDDLAQMSDPIEIEAAIGKRIDRVLRSLATFRPK